MRFVPIGFRLTLCVFMVIAMSGYVYSQRSYNIFRTEEPIKIDGEITESAWEKAEIANDFTVKDPVFGGKSSFETRIRMVYDDDAVYISGEMHDMAPDSVNFNLSQRDSEGNADWFGISIDPYAKNVNAFDFMVTAAGVELDALEGVTSLDFTWNAVWKSVAVKTEYGWAFEMRIPYSAIRFPNKNIQEWNINFWRSVRRRREISTWNPINPNVFGEITQSGKLYGIENIESPVRLAFIPYVSGYVENSYDEDLQRQTWKQRVKGGMDLKYGLNDAFTLDMTLIPDFGQTTSDRKVLNLGPFEVRYNEYRPFFLEGTDLFNIGGIFYSRRIASTPLNFNKPYSVLNDSICEEVVSNPTLAPMINGTKVSGRTKRGLGIGVFNAVEGQTDAIIRDSMGNERIVRTNPLTNYNIFVFSQNLKNNSTVSLINTNVLREGDARDANVTSVGFNMFTPDGNYQVSSRSTFSSIYEDRKYTNGHSLNTSIGKVSGKWQYSFGYGEVSDTYNPNDLGFIYNNNSRSLSGSLRINKYSLGKFFYRVNGGFGAYYNELYKPQLYSSFFTNAFIGGLLKSRTYTRFEMGGNPIGTVDHFTSRHFGHEVLFGPNFYASYMFSTDYSKVFAFDGNFSFTQYVGRSQKGFSTFLSPRFRLSDRMMLILSSNVQYLLDDYGYVPILDDAYSESIILGMRDRVIVENTLSTEFIFTKRMGINVRMRHYWQEVEYNSFVELLDRGEMSPSAYNPVEEDGSSSHNTNYNAFTVDVNYIWTFVPGSQLRIVYKNNIFHSKSGLDGNYFNTFNTLFDQPQINAFSMKLLVYVDVLYFRFKKKRETKKTT